MQRTSMLTLVFQKSLTQQVSTRQDLEDEIYYLEHILPDRNQKENLPAGYGIVVRGTDKIIGLLTSTIATKTMCWRLAIPHTQTIGGEAMCLKRRVLRLI